MKYSSSPRPERSRRSWLLLEKAPFFLLAIASSVVTFLVQQHGGAVIDMTQRPLGMRVGNALAAYVAYLWKMLWPVDLAVLYPLRPVLPMALVIGAGVLVLTITAAVLWRARRHPYLVTGWFWYVGTLVPVIGLVHVGSARMADRYTYIPLIGIFVLGVWTVAAFAERWRWGRAVAGIVAVAVLGLCSVTTARQVRVWQNSIILFEHALAVGEASSIAHNSQGLALANQGKIAEAIAQFQAALRLDPSHVKAHANLAALLAGTGRPAEALAHGAEAVRLGPDDPDAQNNLAVLWVNAGRLAEAITHYQAALRVKPDFADAHYNLGLVLAKQIQWAKAITHYEAALRLKPDFARAHYHLGLALVQHGQPAAAIAHFQEAIRLRPGDADAHNNLGNALARQGQLDAAIAQYQTALRLQPDYAEAHCNLGLALAGQGQPTAAIAQYREALRLAPDNLLTLGNLAWLLATCPEAAVRNGSEAVKLAEQAGKRAGDKDANALDTLAAAYAEAGRFEEAVKTAEKALVLAGTDKAMAGQIESHLKRYRQGQPWREK